MTLREAAQQALEALERVMSHGQAVQEAKDTLLAALARDCPYTSDELRGAHYEGFLKGVAAEREECAKVCEARYMGDNNREDMEAKRCAAAIRSRG